MRIKHRSMIFTTLVLLNYMGQPFAAPTKISSVLNAKAAATTDLITVLDLSKPAFITPQNTEWNTGPNKLPPGASLAKLEGDPALAGPFTIRLKLPANYEIPAHWTATDEHISVISGHLFLGLGDKLDKAKALDFPAGSFSRIPIKMHHFAFTTEETIIQLHGIGPWIIGYVDPADDPSQPQPIISPLEAGESNPTDASPDMLQEVIEQQL